MTAYIDGAHLVADSLEELHAFAASIGLQREWFQDHPEHPHYDIIGRRKANQALNAGAVMTHSREILRISKQLTKGGNDADD